MINHAKKIVRTGITFVQKALTKNIDHLYRESDYNNLMAELSFRQDFDNYQQYTGHRKAFEDKLLTSVKGRYVRLHGVQYQLNRLHNNLSLREAGADGNALNSRMRFCLAIIDHYFTKLKRYILPKMAPIFMLPYVRCLSIR